MRRCPETRKSSAALVYISLFFIIDVGSWLTFHDIGHRAPILLHFWRQRHITRSCGAEEPLVLCEGRQGDDVATIVTPRQATCVGTAKPPPIADLY